MKVLLLRFDAPLMSFGGVVVDQINRTDDFPYCAMLTGLFANALGWQRVDSAKHDELQARIRYAARVDRAGAKMVDYQTVVLSSGEGWTTSGEVEERKGAGGEDSTHIRFRHYLADAILTVAVVLDPPQGSPTLVEMDGALQRPARPLFLGRKCCIPSGPLLLGSVDAPSLRSALEATPRLGAIFGRDRSDRGPLRALFPCSEAGDDPATTIPRVEDRDWHNAIHVGRRIYAEGLVHPIELERTGEAALAIEGKAT